VDNFGNGGADFIKVTTAEEDTNGIDASSFHVFLATLDVERLLRDPESRRAWLLLKALENLRLPEALELAVAADCFVSGDISKSRGTGTFSRLDAAKAVRLSATGGTSSVAVSNGSGIEDHGWLAADTMKLTVLASIDDITRYLGQHGDLITSKGNLFVVNGQSDVTFDELLARANRTRVRQGLPTYAFLPASWR
jgi:hypothetical protein